MSKFGSNFHECLIIGFFKRLLSMGLILLIGNAVHAQQVPKVSDKGRNYLEYLPPGYGANPDQLYPVIIFLHGHGERGNTVDDLVNRVPAHGPPKHIKNGHNMCFQVNGNEECFIVLSPQQTTPNHGWQGVHVIPFIQYALETYKIDPDRVYLTGLSMGGQGAWQTSHSDENEPNYLAAIAPAPGRGGYDQACITAQRAIAVWAFHGTEDNAMSYYEGYRPIRGMEACNADPAPLFTTYEGVGHSGTWQRAYRTDNSLHNPNLYQWLLTQRRGSPPEIPPSVNAGDNITLALPDNNITINASANDPDGSISNISWVQNSGPSTASLGATDQLSLDISNLVEGTYSFSITVTDNDGLTASDQVNVTINPVPPNSPPTVDAGSNITITLPDNSTIINANASDSDGTIENIIWGQSSGPNTATIDNPNNLTINISSLIEGSYSFSLSVTDDEGATTSDNITIVVLPEPVNDPPVANAGPDQEVTLPDNTVSIDASASDSDGSVATVDWLQDSGPNAAIISNTHIADITLSGLVEGSYVFHFTATDNDGDTDTDILVVNVYPPPPNDPPVANAGSDFSISLPLSTATLSGSATDSDGSVASAIWSQVSGPNTATIAAPSSLETSVGNLIEGVYVFSLEATDNSGDNDIDNISLTVLPKPANTPPYVDAGEDVSITLPANSINLSASANDSDGSISNILWQQSSGPNTATIVSPGNAGTEINNLVAGIYQFTVTATDDDGAENIDALEVTVFPQQNIPPEVDAGTDITIVLPASSTTLNGNGSDTDGTIDSYAWSQITGPATSTIGSPNSGSTSVSNLSEGVYTFKLTVTDNGGETASDQVNVTVNPEPFNQPPIADAGEDIILILPDNETTLIGNGTDADGSIVSYVWESLSGPTGEFGNLEQQNLPISELIEGIYLFELTVEDDHGEISTDQVRVIVNSSNLPPSSNAGADITITLPQNTVVLSGSASDPDGNITLTLWEQVDGPTTVDIYNPLNLESTIGNLTEGIYIFNLYVQDDDEETDSDEIRVTVNPAPPNAPPTADAGSDIQIVLPTNSVTLNGGGTDSDGNIDGYVWSQVSGPNTANGSDLTTTSPTYAGLIEGTYIFSLMVTDNGGTEGEDEVRITVLPAPGNQLPDVNAGNDITITLPENQIALSGSAEDVDGSIASVLWTQVAGPTTSTIQNSSSLTTTVSDLNEGVYTFRLTVTDNNDASTFDQIIATVAPDPANVPPSVQTGANQIIRLPVNSVSFDATAEDIDGSISRILWSQVSGPTMATLSAADEEDITASNLVLGTYIFRISVTDDEGAIGFDQVNVRVLQAPDNQPPLVSTIENIILFDPENSTEISAEATDGDGSVESVLWSQVSGPTAANIEPATSLNSNASNLSQGTYVFKVTATDNDGLSGFDQMNVRVNPPNPNIPPVTYAGPDQELSGETDGSTELEGQASDSDGSIVSINWTQKSGPNTATFSNTEELTPTVSNLITGTYVFRLTVGDNKAGEDFDEVVVIVLPEAPNSPPVVNAGVDVSTIYPNNALTLSGSASDGDGNIASIQWSVESGPASSAFSDANSLETTITDLEIGTYVCRLTVEDNKGGTSFDELTIFVNENLLPSAFAGDDIEISLPENTVTLTGSGADADGYIVNQQWSQISGLPASVNSIDTNTIEISGLSPGTYEFGFTVTDDLGGESTDFVSVSVLPSGDNLPPVANAGEDITIHLPINSVLLAGSGSDQDGAIVQYRWEQISGMPVTIASPGEAETQVNDLAEGTFGFKLSVTDNGGQSGSDSVRVFVLPATELYSLNIPRIFTPNNDGINDVWEIGQIQAVECKVTVFSSTGYKILEASPYLNNWDGTYKGEELQPGAYYYVIECKGEKRSGGVRIVR